MKIGIDGRLINQTGVGRYIRNLVTHLGRIDEKNEYIIFLGKDALDAFVVPNDRWKKVQAFVRWHTVREQLMMPRLFRSHACDLVHIPYFNIPIFNTVPMVVTIHDLTVLTYPTGKATLLPKPLYLLKHLAYRLVLAIGLRKAVHIIAVSETTKHDIMQRFPFCIDKVSVTYEGVGGELRMYNEQCTMKKLAGQKYYLYVGNAYPHKNLHILLNALTRMKKENMPIKMVFAGPEDYFYIQLKHEIARRNLTDSVLFFGKATDEQLYWLYVHAHAFVFPSLSEGFGLPAIEALSLGCPVICSDIPVFHELLGDIPVYVDPKDNDQWAKIMIRAASEPKKQMSIHTDKFSWEKMALSTVDIYERSTRL